MGSLLSSGSVVASTPTSDQNSTEQTTVPECVPENIEPIQDEDLKSTITPPHSPEKPAVSTKPIEPKSTEIKLTEAKPMEIKITEIKPTETKPMEIKITESKPTENKITEPKPEETKSNELKAEDSSSKRTPKRKRSGYDDDIAFAIIATNKNITSDDEDDEQPDDSMNTGDELLFSGCTFALSGVFSQSHAETIEMIKAHGGAVAGISKKATHLVTTEDEVETKTKKVESAKELGLKIISEDFIHDSIQENKKVDETGYLLIKAGKKKKKTDE